MSEIFELQARLSAALERIAGGVESMPVAAPEPVVPEPVAADAGEVEALKQALEDEKLVTAQLEERLRAIKAKQKEAEETDAALQGTATRMAELDKELQRLRKANTQLREVNQALREANQSGVGEPHLINKSMLTELEALRAARAVDVAEAETIRAALEPLLSDATEDAAEGEDA